MYACTHLDTEESELRQVWQRGAKAGTAGPELALERQARAAKGPVEIEHCLLRLPGAVAEGGAGAMAPVGREAFEHAQCGDVALEEAEGEDVFVVERMVLAARERLRRRREDRLIDSEDAVMDQIAHGPETNDRAEEIRRGA